MEWGPAITHCLNGYWSCVLYTLSQLHKTVEEEEEEEVVVEKMSKEVDEVVMGTTDVCRLVDVCMDYLDVAGSNLATPLYCLSLLVPKVHTGSTVQQ